MLGEASNCIDVGANEGLLLELFTRLAPGGRHIAYEPVPALASRLQRRFPQAEVRDVAVADHSGETTFVMHKRLASRSSLHPVGHAPDQTQTINVPLTTLDEDLPAGYRPHLVKIDVEGAEHLVLQGAMRTLQSSRPVVLFEHQRSTARHYASGPELMYDLLVTDLDMRIFDMDGSGPYSLRELRDAYESGSRWNFAAVPVEGLHRAAPNSGQAPGT